MNPASTPAKSTSANSRRSTASAFSQLVVPTSAIVSVEAAQAIIDAISAGRLRVGDKLPPERTLAAIMGISRSSLRDALKLLSGMGIVHVRRSSGVFVADLDERHDGVRDLSSPLLLQRGPIVELFELREVLETQAAGWAAMRASTASIEEMQALHQKAMALAERDTLSSEEAGRLDAELHRLIAKSTGNTVLLSVMDNLRDLLDKSRGYTTIIPGRMKTSIEEIGRVIKFIRRRDPEQAQKEMYLHLKRGQQANMLSAAKLVTAQHSGEDAAGSGR
jgi:GntR family transcriptional repressor for pyruvate dehydrogenase complex